MSSPDRATLRRQLLDARRVWAASPAFASAELAVQNSLRELLAQLEPEVLGLYWPLAGEFDLRGAVSAWPLALPFARKGQGMDYRRWDGAEPALRDECDIPSSAGAVVVPDVVIAPCVGFTREGFRLGYGGGYFDRWLSRHPGVMAVGVAPSGAETHFAALPHDRALMVVVTERELVTPD